MGEPKPGVEQFFRLDMLAFGGQFVAHLAHDGQHDEGRRRQKGWGLQGFADGFCERGIIKRAGRYNIDGSDQMSVFNQIGNPRGHVDQADSRDHVQPAAQLATDIGVERSSHFLETAILRREHDTNAKKLRAYTIGFFFKLFCAPKRRSCPAGTHLPDSRACWSR